MSHRYLRTYVPSIRVDARDAKQDKIEIVLGDWFIGPSDDSAYIHFFSTLAPAPAGALAEETENIEGLFYRDRDYDPTCPKLAIRAGGRGTRLAAGRPLFSGELRTFKFGRAEPIGIGNTEAARRIELRLFLNPTRYLHHQPKRSWVLSRHLGPLNWDLGQPQLVSREPDLSSLEEHVLNRDDNVLMGRAAVLMGAQPGWPIHLERYWLAVVDRLNELFHGAARDADLALRPSTHLNLRMVETYWEFAVRDPLAWLREVEPLLEPLGHSAEARTFQFPDGMAVSHRTGNARSLYVRLRSGVALRLYAKTTHRVRFEIIHDLTEHARPLGGAHTSRTLQQFSIWCGALAADAAAQLNVVLDVLERGGVREGSDASVVHLITRITQVVRDDMVSTRILELLAANGAVVPSSGAGLTRAVRRLKEAGILEAVSSGARAVRLSREYASAGVRLRRLAQRDEHHCPSD